jgi:hypothetical protein
MSYFIAIPSYKRADILNQQTLQCLNKHGIKKELINIFVTEEDYEEYLDKLNPQWYHQLIKGHPGLIKQRQFIENYFDSGTHIVSMDDDIKAIDLSLSEFHNLNTFLEQAFEDLKNKNAFIWGVYPVFNPYFRKTKPPLSTDLKYIVGAFYGFINRKTNTALKLTLQNDNKEDVERSIKYFINDGIVLRYNKIGFETKYYGTDGGGMGRFNNRLEPMKASAMYLQNKYPYLCKLKIRKSGMCEVELKKLKAYSPLLLHPIDPSRDDIQHIYALLESITIPLNTNKTGRARTFGDHRAMTLGFVKARISRQYGLSRYSKKFSELYEAVKAFGESICPFEFTSIHINYNVVCPKHLDPENVGNSMLVSFGDYKGCDLEIENHGSFNTNCQPIIFNGSKHFHWNTPLEYGNKYSLVFFNTKNE